MKIEHMECPRCGASLAPKKGDKEVICQFCGAAFQIKDEVNLEEIRAKAESKSYGYHKGKLRAEIEADAIKKQNSVNVLLPLLIIGAVLLLLGAGIAIRWFAMPKVDPFACATVSFEGIDGEGKVTILGNDPEIMMNRIEYEFSKEFGLCEGEVITVSAQSSNYRLIKKTMTYTVEGLTKYLSDLDNIPDAALELIHTRAKEDQKINLETAINSDYLKSMEPVMLFLSTDGKQNNLLYDVFEARFETPKGEVICYPVTVYEDVIISKEQSASVKMSYGMYQGTYIQIESANYITAYESLEAIRAELATNQDIDMELKELVLR